MKKTNSDDLMTDKPMGTEEDYLTDTLESYNAGDSRDVRATDIEDLAKDTQTPAEQSTEQIAEEESTGGDKIFDEDADNPEAATPGHPGVDEDTA